MLTHEPLGEEGSGGAHTANHKTIEVIREAGEGKERTGRDATRIKLT